MKLIISTTPVCITMPHCFIFQVNTQYLHGLRTIIGSFPSVSHRNIIQVVQHISQTKQYFKRGKNMGQEVRKNRQSERKRQKEREKEYIRKRKNMVQFLVYGLNAS